MGGVKISSCLEVAKKVNPEESGDSLQKKGKGGNKKIEEKKRKIKKKKK